MADLEQILASGIINDSKVLNSPVVTEDTLGSAISNVPTGIPIPAVDSALAAPGTMFFDPVAGQIRYKTPANILLRFRMQVV